MVAINQVARQNAREDIGTHGPQRTKLQSFMRGIKKAGRILGGVATLGISEGIIRHTLKGRGCKVSSRASDTTSIGMNHYLRNEMNSVLNGTMMSAEFTNRIDAEKNLGSLPGIADETLAVVFGDSVRDFSRANYSIGGEQAESGKEVLERMITLCTTNDEIDHGALRAITSLANQSIFGALGAAPMISYANEDPPIFLTQRSPDSNLSYNVESVINSNGEQEFLIRAGVDMETFNINEHGKDVSGIGSQAATIRLTKNEDGSWKANLEDYQCNLKPTEGHTLLRPSAKRMGQLVREYITENTGVISAPVQNTGERKTAPTSNRLGVVVSHIHEALSMDKEIAGLRDHVGDVGTIFRGNSKTTRTLTSITKELSVNYVQDTLKTVVDYVNTTGPIDMRTTEGQEKLRGLFEGLMGKLIGGSECKQENIDLVPQEVCDVCKTVFTRLLAAGANETTARNGALNFLFLRTLSPALALSAYPDPILGNLGGKPEAQSTSLHLSKMLQFSVNGITEPHNPNFAQLSDTLKTYQPGMESFMTGILVRGLVKPENPVHQHFVELLDVAPQEVRNILENGDVFDSASGLGVMKENIKNVLSQISRKEDFGSDPFMQKHIRGMAPALRNFLDEH